jgi:endonuclease/exonuclease/phosphatase family metal-dependent hydrolase
MKLLLFAVLVPGLFSIAESQEISLNVLTYNIRLVNPGDAPNTWNARKENVFSVMREAKPDVFGLQEAVYEQVVDMQNAFAEYKRIGVGRDDGKEAGEYSPVFFNAEKYTMLNSGTFWLSQTPSVPGSRGWDAACNRVVSWGQFKENKTEIVFFIFCTHFDHMGEIARQKSAHLILHAVDSLAGNKPAIVLGDFNSTPDSEPFHIITDKTSPMHLTDAKAISKYNSGPKYTFTGFRVGAQPGTRIDYIFVKNSVQAVSFTVNETNNGDYYPSDHLPVSAVLKIK